MPAKAAARSRIGSRKAGIGGPSVALNDSKL